MATSLLFVAGLVGAFASSVIPCSERDCIGNPETRELASLAESPLVVEGRITKVLSLASSDADAAYVAKLGDVHPNVLDQFMVWTVAVETVHKGKLEAREIVVVNYIYHDRPHIFSNQTGLFFLVEDESGSALQGKPTFRPVINAPHGFIARTETPCGDVATIDPYTPLEAHYVLALAAREADKEKIAAAFDRGAQGYMGENASWVEDGMLVTQIADFAENRERRGAPFCPPQMLWQSRLRELATW